MKSLETFKNKFGASILTNKQSNFIKGGTDSSGSNDDSQDDELIGEPWDKRGPRPGTKGK